MSATRCAHCSTGSVVTEREAVLRERAAIKHVVTYLTGRGYFRPGLEVQPGEDPRGEIDRHVLVRYPLPKVTRPRVVNTRDCGQWRYVDGHYEQRSGDRGTWHEAPSGFVIPIGQVDEIAALRTNPTEEVEEGTP